MRTRLLLAIPIAAVAVAAWVAGTGPVSGANGPQKATLAAVALTPVGYSTHNNPGTPVCGPAEAKAYVPPSGVSEDTNGEVRGQLDNAKGSFEGFLRLPSGVTVTGFSVFVNDADQDDDVFAYLVRRNIADGLDKTKGYLLMASTRSDGAVINTIREFEDTTITAKVVDNSHFAYFVELVDCGIPEAFAVSVTYTGA
jgi:hypothetical protein